MWGPDRRSKLSFALNSLIIWLSQHGFFMTTIHPSVLQSSIAQTHDWGLTRPPILVRFLALGFKQRYTTVNHVLRIPSGTWNPIIISRFFSTRNATFFTKATTEDHIFFSHVGKHDCKTMGVEVWMPGIHGRGQNLSVLADFSRGVRSTACQQPDPLDHWWNGCLMLLQIVYSMDSTMRSPHWVDLFQLCLDETFQAFLAAHKRLRCSIWGLERIPANADAANCINCCGESTVHAPTFLWIPTLQVLAHILIHTIPLACCSCWYCVAYVDASCSCWYLMLMLILVVVWWWVNFSLWLESHESCHFHCTPSVAVYCRLIKWFVKWFIRACGCNIASATLHFSVVFSVFE